jgi:hypothetical protein
MDFSVPFVLFSVAKCRHNHGSNLSQYYPELDSSHRAAKRIPGYSLTA